jgi:hypothetical protein
MVKTTRKQREAIFRVFLRDFPSWVTPTQRLKSGRETGTGASNVMEHMAFAKLYPETLVKVPSVQYRRFRATVQPGPGCIMLHWKGMWLGIEPDGYTHS